MKRMITALLLPALLAASAALHAMESGTFLQDDILRKKPEASAKVLGTVEKGTKVEILRIYGPWYLVSTGKSAGWVVASHLRRHDSSFGPGFGGPSAFGGAGSVHAAPAAGGAATLSPQR